MNKTPRKTPRLALSLLAVGLLAMTAFASTALAKPGDDAREKRVERSEIQERRGAAADAWKEQCRPDNATLNESMQRRCMVVKHFHDNATKARREARALYGAIAALERRIGRLEVREESLEDKLAAGNFTGNQTAESLQEAIDRIEEHQERAIERLQHLKERLAALHEKWQNVRDHVADRRGHGGDDEDDDEGEPSASTSASSTSTSASDTSTSA